MPHEPPIPDPQAAGSCRPPLTPREFTQPFIVDAYAVPTGPSLQSPVSPRKPETGLGEADTEALASLNRKTGLIRDYVTAVAKKYKHGLYLFGAGGVGKSYTVLERLKELGVTPHLHNSRMTAKGLFLALRDARESVHVLEDMERLTKEPDAQGVLRSALWAQPTHPRMVTWTTAKDPAAFEFLGGLILISNAPLANLPELQALATRIEVHKVEVTEAELTAKMRELAARGYQVGGEPVMSPEDCGTVTEHLLAECRAAASPLDLRLQQKAFQTFRQHADGHAANHWQDLVAASVRETACRFRHEAEAGTPEERQARRRNDLRGVMAAFPKADWQVEYIKTAKASRADYFRMKKQVDSGEFDAADAR